MMPDITMCINSECPMRHKCYRSSDSGTQMSDYQSISRFKPKSDNECEFYWETK